MTLPLTSFPLEFRFESGAASSKSLVRPRESSSASSIVVAVVEYEPLAEELRLCGGEWTLDWASDILLPALAEMVMPSPAELSKLGVCDERKLAATLALGDFLVLDAFRMLEPPSEVLFLIDVVDAIEADVGGPEFAFGG